MLAGQAGGQSPRDVALDERRSGDRDSVPQFQHLDVDLGPGWRGLTVGDAHGDGAARRSRRRPEKSRAAVPGGVEEPEAGGHVLPARIDVLILALAAFASAERSRDAGHRAVPGMRGEVEITVLPRDRNPSPKGPVFGHRSLAPAPVPHPAVLPLSVGLEVQRHLAQGRKHRADPASPEQVALDADRVGALQKSRDRAAALVRSFTHLPEGVEDRDLRGRHRESDFVAVAAAEIDQSFGRCRSHFGIWPRAGDTGGRQEQR